MSEPVSVKEERQQIEAAYFARCHDDPLAFFLGLNIPAAGKPVRFDRCMQDFQRDCFEDLAPALVALRNGEKSTIRRFWIERTKKAAKDSDIAACLMWLAAYASRPMYIQVAAADRDQAAIVKRRMNDLLYYNEWLSQMVTAQQNSVRSANGLVEIEILAADVAGSHGETPDLLVVNELSHINRWEFIENLLDNADGVPHGMIIIATNAGVKGSKAEAMRRVAIGNDRWSIHLWTKPAPWLNPGDVAEAKKRNSTSRYNRLWRGRWVSGLGDALDEDDIDKIFPKHAKPLMEPEPGWDYIAALDLGVKNDHSGLVVLGINGKEQRLKVAQLRAWNPADNSGEVNLIEVEAACVNLANIFRVRWFGFDPSQAILMGQRLRARGIPMEPVWFSGNALDAMAAALLGVIQSAQLESYDIEGGRLRRDFGKMSIVEKSYGYRMEATKDEFGHADLGTALVILLPTAVDMLAGHVSDFGSDDIIAWDEEGELSKEEYANMPQELKDICDAVDELGK